MSKDDKPLRSRQWYGGNGKGAFMHRSWMKNQGVPDDLFDGRPVIGICNTWSEMTPCNAHLRGLAEKVKFGVYDSAGSPLEFPVLSPSESQTRPTAMLYRIPSSCKTADPKVIPAWLRLAIWACPKSYWKKGCAI